MKDELLLSFILSMRSRGMTFYFLSFASLLLFTISPALAQQSVDTNAKVESRLDHYMKFAHPIGTVRMEFVGPKKGEHPSVGASTGGYTFLHMPTQEITESGDTVVKDRTYLLDLSIAHAGLYLAPDTMLSVKDYSPFQFIFGKDRIIHTELAPSHTHEEMLALDSNFNGVLGYGFITQFVTVFDFRRNTLTFYPLFANISIADNDSNTLQLPVLDDAKVTYCGCAYHTMWLDVQAPPLNAGHVNLAFHEPQSEVFISALDSTTRGRINMQHLEDSLNHSKRPLGLNLTQFVVGKDAGHPVNFATRGPHRLIDTMPAIYHDLNVPILGTLGTDVLRTFSGIIIDPSRNKLIFVR